MQDERDRLEKEHEATKKQLERMLEKQKKTQEEIDAKLDQIKKLELSPDKLKRASETRIVHKYNQLSISHACEFVLRRNSKTTVDLNLTF